MAFDSSHSLINQLRGIAINICTSRYIYITCHKLVRKLKYRVKRSARRVASLGLREIRQSTRKRREFINIHNIPPIDIIWWTERGLLKYSPYTNLPGASILFSSSLPWGHENSNPIFPFIQKIQRRSLYNSNPSHEPPTTTKSSPGKVRVLQAPIPTPTSPSSSSSLLVAIETRHFTC